MVLRKLLVGEKEKKSVTSFHQPTRLITYSTVATMLSVVAEQVLSLKAV